MKKTNSRYTRRSNYGAQNGGAVKKAVLRQTAVCLSIFALIFLLKDTFFEKNGIPYKLAGVILTENTDFKENWQEIKAFFAEQVKVTALLTSETELDPVKNMKAPTNGEVYRKFGLESKKDGTEEFCYGVKIKTAQKTKICAVQNGEIAETGVSPDWGNYILIKHSEKIYTFYAFLGEILPEFGDKVKSGQVIATAEENKAEGFPMLYFEVRDGESMLDPEAFIDFSQNGESAS